MKREVRELLRPFFRWRPKLQPALPDLNTLVKKAVFWDKEVPEAIAVSTGLILFWSGRRKWLWQSLTTNLERELNSNLDQKELNNLKEEFEDVLPFGLKGGMIIENRLWEAVRELWYGLDSIERQTELRREMQLNWRCSMFLAAGFSLVGDKSKNFQPLLDLWLRGNPPLWFTREDELLVLCRKPF